MKKIGDEHLIFVRQLTEVPIDFEVPFFLL